MLDNECGVYRAEDGYQFVLKKAFQLFMDGKTYLILLIPLAYSLYFCFFTSPLLFNSDATAWFFSTFAPGHNHELVGSFICTNSTNSITTIYYEKYPRSSL
ncbi:hypothetical protein ANCCEY_06880 [Ancylostoma ceylanicum]|uniref:7TM GPCR serpentine receptor class x (Srx) domain-containing protein n=1 Tax=Ancylostoma ceylanicum TaxID=53326 RepID=A0A0D6LPS2_9BILA|nr:hypothetical protein ANCCEY_06880 [Ancylostoma ceylanicum]